MKKILIADSGSTSTGWALVEAERDVPTLISTHQTMGLNPLYASAEKITETMRSVLDAFGEAHPDEVCFYGSGCSEARVQMVEQALRRALTPPTSVMVASDLLGAARAVWPGRGEHICCIMGTGSIASLYDGQRLTPMPALGYILGDEGSGAWFGRRVLSDYLKRQMPASVREAFEDDFGVITPEQAIKHVYTEPFANRYLATFAAFLGRHSDHRYYEEVALEGMEAFFVRNVDRIREISDCSQLSMVGSVAYHLRRYVESVALIHGFAVAEVVQSPIEGLVRYHQSH